MSKCYSCTIARGGDVYQTEDCISRQHALMPPLIQDVPRADFDEEIASLARATESQDIDTGVHYYASGESLGTEREVKNFAERVRYAQAQAGGKA